MAISKQEINFLSTLASTRKNIFTFEDARVFWSTSSRTANALSRLARKGWIKRLDRGTYLIVPLEAGPEQTWSESGLVIAPYLVNPAAVAYWSALHYWNMTEQIPQTTFVQTTVRKQSMTLFGQEFRFITVRPERFFGTYERTADDRRIIVTDQEKTLLDAAARPDLSGGIAQLSQAMKAANSVEPKQYGPVLAKIKYKGVAGEYEFDSKHDLKQSPVTIFRFKDGVPVALTSY